MKAKQNYLHRFCVKCVCMAGLVAILALTACKKESHDNQSDNDTSGTTSYNEEHWHW